jgi:hypothetical protein
VTVGEKGRYFLTKNSEHLKCANIFCKKHEENAKKDRASVK